MESAINERINCIMLKFSIKSVRQFANNIGVAATSLNDIVRNGAEPKFSTLEKILKAEPSISAEWLLRGEGEMLRLPSSNNVINDSVIDELKAEINQLKGENRILREQAGLGERKEDKSA